MEIVAILLMTGVGTGEPDAGINQIATHLRSMHDNPAQTESLESEMRITELLQLLCATTKSEPVMGQTEWNTIRIAWNCAFRAEAQNIREGALPAEAPPAEVPEAPVVKG